MHFTSVPPTNVHVLSLPPILANKKTPQKGRLTTTKRTFDQVTLIDDKKPIMNGEVVKLTHAISSYRITLITSMQRPNWLVPWHLTN